MKFPGSIGNFLLSTRLEIFNLRTMVYFRHIYNHFLFSSPDAKTVVVYT